MQMPQMPQTPQMGTPLPEVPPFGGQQQPTQPVTYNQGTTNQPYAQPQYGPSNNSSPQQKMAMPKTWLTESVIGTVLALLCCSIIGLIPGIIAIVNANGVKSKYMAGDYDGANRKSSSAKLWFMITIGVILASAIYSAYTLLSNPELLKQIQEGSVGSLYGF